MHILHICGTNQHTDEPQVYSVVLLKPGSINMKSVADEAYHGVVCEDDQDEKNQCDDHLSSEKEQQKNTFNYEMKYDRLN